MTEVNKSIEQRGKRYRQWCLATHQHELLEAEYGSWVRFEDFDQLRSILFDLCYEHPDTDKWARAREAGRTWC